MAAKFVASNRVSPILNSMGKTHIHITRQEKGYKKDDPARKHEKALPPIVFRHRLRMAHSKREKARANLLGGALFFAERSCEYSYVGAGERKTRPNKAKDVVFRVGNEVMPHNDPNLHLAETVSIDFGDQKTDIKDETVTQFASDDPELNPVKHLAYTIRRLQKYPGYSEEWELYTFYDGKKFSKITGNEILLDVRNSVDAIGPKILGFTSKEVGTHSVRASLAMMMYLAKEPVYTIMLIARWSSDAFLAYIEKQIKDFTKGVSSRMLKNETFFNVPLANTEHEKSNTTHGRSHHRRTCLGIYGQKAGSTRHQHRPRN